MSALPGHPLHVGHNNRVLVLASDEDERCAIYRAFNRTRFEVHLCASFAELLRESAKAYGIIADLGDTIEVVTSNLHILEGTTDRPVIVIAPGGAARIGLAALSSGADDVIFRPVLSRELFVRFRSATRRFGRRVESLT